MSDQRHSTNWIGKFAAAFAGINWAVRSQSSFWVHIPIAIVVLVIAAVLQVELWRWVAIVFAIALVGSAELLNSAIENIVRVLHPEQDERIGQALDAGAGAVLVAAIGSVVIGMITLGPPLWNAIFHSVAS